MPKKQQSFVNNILFLFLSLIFWVDRNNVSKADKLFSQHGICYNAHFMACFCLLVFWRAFWINLLPSLLPQNSTELKFWFAHFEHLLLLLEVAMLEVLEDTELPYPNIMGFII